MKRALFGFCLFLLALPFGAHAAGDERILDFSVRLNVRPDRTLQVQERITYNPGTVTRHGIYRELPVTYTKQGSRYSVRYTLHSVTNASGARQQTDVSYAQGKFRIRIGNPEVTITGDQVYLITYSVQRALPMFDGKDEVYWNVTGNDWDMPIDAAQLTLTLPDGREPERVACYTGPAGSTTTNCTTERDATGNVVVKAKTLLANEGLTVAAQLPSGLVAAETTATKWKTFLLDNWSVAVPIITFLLMHWLWHTRGRDPKGRGTIIPQYEPPRRMPPAVVGAVPDTTVGAQEFSATILHLAMRGYLNITDLGKAGVLTTKRNYEFARLKDTGPDTKQYEKTLLTGLFASGSIVTTTQLKYKFAKTYQQVISDVRKQLIERGFYVRDPHVTQATTIVTGLVLVVAIGMVANLVQPPLLAVTWVSLFAAGIAVIIYGLLMPSRTRLGAEVLEEVRGFQWFLSVTEAERLKFHNAPARKPEQFMELLPFAVALGVEKQWAEQFKDLAVVQPDWYNGNLTTFNALVFANAIGSMSSDVKSTLAAVPGGSGSGGGGFSGGGLGGGGGGGW